MNLLTKGIDDIQSVASSIAFYGAIVLLCLGLIGNGLNILVFATLRLFRKNPSAFCILVESMANFGQISVALLAQFLYSGFGISSSTNSLVWCKLRNVLQQIFNLIFMEMICLAAFDQYLSTNPRYQLRQISSLKLIQYLIIVLVSLTLLHGIPFLIFFDLQPYLGCVIKNSILSMYYSSFYYPVLIGLLPTLFTIILGSISFYHVRHLIRRGMSTVRRRLDRQLTAMIFVRVLSFIILTLPYIAERILALNIYYNKIAFSSVAIIRLVSMIITLFFSANYAVSRYLFLCDIQYSKTNRFFR